MGRYLLVACAFIALVALLAAGLPRDPSVVPSPFLNHPAPSYELPSLTQTNKTVNSSAFAGKQVLVNVWATWCIGCREEHSFLVKLAQENVIPVYGINWQDDRTEAQKWLQQLGNPYVEVGYDGNGSAGIDWGVYGAPETFLINAQGIVVYKHLGPIDEAVWERDFVPKLANGGAGS